MTEQRPILFRDHIGQIEFELYRIAVFGQLQPAGEPDHVCVAGNGGDPESVAQHDIGGLSADARQRQELLHGGRDLAAEVIDDLAARALEVDGLVVIEAAGSDVLLDLLQVRRGPIGRGPVLLEQVFRDQVDPDIRALGGEDRRDQQFQRIREMQRDGGVGVGLLQDR